MQSNVPMVKLGEVLTERQEKPDLESVMMGQIPIIAKIGFNTGIIEYRDGFDTKTNMILVKPGDLVVSGINAEKGAIALYDESNSKNCAATIHYSSYSIDKKKAEPKFLWFFFRSEMFRNILIQSLPNGIKTEVKPFRLLKLEIPLPPLDKQRRVVLILERLLMKIEEARKELAEAVKETQAINMNLIKSQFLPHYDKMKKVGDIFRVTTGGTPSRSNPLYWNGDVNWISSGEVNFSRISGTFEKITTLGNENSNAKINPPNTVLVAMIGQGKTRGQCAILDCFSATNQNVAAIHVYETENLPEYVYWWFYSQYFESRISETGTAQPALSGQRIKEMLIPIPPPQAQRRIVAHLDRLQAKVDEVKRLQAETEREMEALVPAVLAKAFC